jgi:ubiquinone/menaquinone biosynthesis C-methylase UbiE
MSNKKEKQDKHFPISVFDNPIRRFIEPSHKLVQPYISKDMVAADLGCGPGYYTIAMAKLVGSKGKVYSVDSDEKSIQALEDKIYSHGYQNIETHASSAHDLSFIRDDSVDFILAHGLLCSMAPKHHESAVNEMKRILNPRGQAYISAARGFYSYVSKVEWNNILKEFSVIKRSDGFHILGDRWVLVSKK